jgi:hypothetical protein
MTQAAILIFLSCLAVAQTELPAGVLILSRIRQKMSQNLSRLPDYICVETIVRAQRAAESSPFRPVDTVRVEVLHVDDRELYSWPGEKKYQDSLGLLIAGGTTSSGEFALHARSIFLGDSQSTYFGEEMVRGRRALRYDYRIGLLSSGMTLGYAGFHGRVATRGSFWVDPETFDLLRFDVHAEQIPPDLPYSGAISTVDYGRVRIGDSETLLPQSAEVVLNNNSGAASRNHLQFSQCRGYGARSEIRYDAELSATPAPKLDQPVEIDLPADLRLGMQLEQELNSNGAAEGDLITARIETAVKKKNVVLIPAGALVRGRIRRLETYHQPRPHFIVGLEFLEISFDGKRAAFTGRLDWIQPLPGISWLLHTSKSKSFSDAVGEIDTTHNETIRTADLPGVGTFFVEGAQFKLPAGLHMLWRTVELKK